MLSFFRSGRRNTANDVVRLSPLLDGTRSALREAEAELMGLRVRLEDVGQRAAFLFGPEVETPADNDPKSKAILNDLEAQLKRGSTRERYLRRQIGVLSQVADALAGEIDYLGA